MAWDFGVAISLVVVALTVVAVAYLGRYAPAAGGSGSLAAACWTAWPLLVGLIAGHDALGERAMGGRRRACTTTASRCRRCS